MEQLRNQFIGGASKRFCGRHVARFIDTVMRYDKVEAVSSIRARYLAPRKERMVAGGPLSYHAVSDSRPHKTVVAFGAFARNEYASDKVSDV